MDVLNRSFFHSANIRLFDILLLYGAFSNKIPSLALGPTFTIHQGLSALSAVAVHILPALSAVCVSGPQGQVNDVGRGRPDIPRAQT